MNQDAQKYADDISLFVKNDEKREEWLMKKIATNSSNYRENLRNVTKRLNGRSRESVFVCTGWPNSTTFHFYGSPYTTVHENDFRVHHNNEGEKPDFLISLTSP